ncbi:MAG: type transport system permease protein [Thermoleophilaceae bacterium]|jgi:ABC-2 type transport system permease protein|nr:type transport system permease protein [Thermoleophilaceae bacterium]
MTTATARPPAPAPVPQEIRGPSAYGGSTRRFINLTWLLAITEFRLAYFGSALGYLWSLMRPLLFFGVLYVVFSEVIRFGDNIKDYPMVLLTSIVLFLFFTEATGNSVRSVLNRESLVRKMQFPRMVIPVSTVLTSALNLMANLVAVLVFLVAYGIKPHWQWLLLPVLLVLLIAFTSGVAMMLSSLYVTYRDVAPIWTVVSQLLFYATPVLYTFEQASPGWQRHVIMSNPLACILEQGRRWMVDPDAPGAAAAAGGFGWFMIPVAIFILVCVLGLWVFNREAPKIAERL